LCSAHFFYSSGCWHRNTSSNPRGRADLKNSRRHTIGNCAQAARKRRSRTERSRQRQFVCRSPGANTDKTDEAPARAAAGTSGHHASREQTAAHIHSFTIFASLAAFVAPANLMDIQENIALAPLTTLRVGGSARYFACATS